MGSSIYVLLWWVYLGELESIVAELEESNHNLATLKAEREGAKGAVFPVLNVGTKHVAGDKIRDKQKDLHDMESSLKEILVLLYFSFFSLCEISWEIVP